MNIVVLILAIGAGLSFMASAIQGLIAWHSADIQLQKKLRLSIIGCILLTMVLVGASYYSVQNSPAQISASAHGSGSPSSIPGATSTSANHTSSAGVTGTAPASTAYSASQPGPRCDTGAGVWTLQGIDSITCGTQITINSSGTLGYMYFQLPNNAAFSSNNEISIAGGPLLNGNFFGYNCLGLAEQDANTGILGEYCGNGSWSINSISSAGAIIKTLASGLTSTSASEHLSLVVSDTTATFSIDNEVHKTSISSIQPAKVAIMFSQGMRPEGISVQNFSYVASASSSVAETPTVTTSTSTAYSASQPGPRCDTGAGVWTPQDIGNITCGTQITINSAGTRGYMYFQLPNNAAFSSNNQISIAGGPLLNGNFFGYNCLGLAEQDANTGILGEYCGNGNWSINVISSAGAIIKTVASGLTSTRASEQLSLIVNATTASFSIDNEVHKVSTSSIKPAKVALMFSQGMRPESISIQNFSYLSPAS